MPSNLLLTVSAQRWEIFTETGETVRTLKLKRQGNSMPAFPVCDVEKSLWWSSIISYVRSPVCGCRMVAHLAVLDDAPIRKNDARATLQWHEQQQRRHLLMSESGTNVSSM